MNSLLIGSRLHMAGTTKRPPHPSPPPLGGGEGDPPSAQGQPKLLPPPRRVAIEIRNGLLPPALSSRGGEGEDPRRGLRMMRKAATKARSSPSPPLEERAGER